MSRSSRTLMVGAFQFGGSGDAARNASALERGIEEAARRGVRLLATQECAACGYPPVEVESLEAVDPQAQAACVRRIGKLARRHEMFVVLGLMTFTRLGAQNSVRLVSPDGRARKAYHKRALYGWDEDHFTPGVGPGAIHVVDGLRLGLRVCYEARFPEYFRELFQRQADLVVVSFADVGGTEEKYDVMRSHLVSRAAENGMYVLSANSCSSEQGAPTVLIDPDGRVMAEAPRNQEALITGMIQIGDVPFGRRGRILHSNRLQKGST